MRFSERELALIKNTFADNEDLLKVIRRVMLQMPLSEADEQKLELLRKSEAVLDLIRKAFLPELEPDAPINQLIDLWMTVKIEDKHPEESKPFIVARELLIDYLDQQLKVLGGRGTEKIKFADLTGRKGKKIETVYSNLLARNSMISHTEIQLFQFSVLAGFVDETIEQTMERISKDSSK